MNQKEYIVEFKAGERWIQTRPISAINDSSDASGALQVEKAMHDVGMKARVVILTTDREILGA